MPRKPHTRRPSGGPLGGLTPQERRELIRARREQELERQLSALTKRARPEPEPKPLTLFNLVGDAILQLAFENLQLRRVGRQLHRYRKK